MIGFCSRENPFVLSGLLVCRHALRVRQRDSAIPAGLSRPVSPLQFPDALLTPQLAMITRRAAGYFRRFVLTDGRR